MAKEPIQKPSPGKDINFVYSKFDQLSHHRIVITTIILLVIANIGAYALRSYVYNGIVDLVGSLPTKYIHHIISPTPTSSAQATPVPNKPEGQFCGGIAGIQCPSGYECKLDGNYPDAGGTCTNRRADFCAQVITSAKNPQTGEVKDFPTPCDVPDGWQKI